MITRRYYLSGRVQGVFFRQSTVDEATRLGLSGYARNLQDGRVEVVAQGDQVMLDRLLKWLHHGPANAEVTEIQQEELDTEVAEGFFLRY